MSQDQEDQTFNKKAREYWDSLSEEEKKDFSQRVLEPTFKIMGDSFGRITKELNKIAKAMKPLGEYMDAHRETVDRWEEWPEITGWTLEELDELTIKEAIELVEKSIKEGPQPRPVKTAEGGSTVTVRVDTVRSVIKQAEAAKEIAEQVEAANKLYELYLTIPSSALINLSMMILNNPKRVTTTRRNQIKKSKHYLTGDEILTYNGSNSEFEITLKQEHLRKFTKGPKAFSLILEKYNEQHRPINIVIPTSEFIERGIYANKDSAQKGLTQLLEHLAGILLVGDATEYSGKKKINHRTRGGAIVSEWDVDFAYCQVRLPSIFKQYAITILPNWAYSLNSNAFMLISYIYYLARQRQNYENIKRQSYFNIKLETIRAHLGLPTLKEAGRNSNNLIMNPIEKAIDEIEYTAKGQRGKLSINRIYEPDKKALTKSYLEGYLKIELDETAQTYMEERAASQRQEYKKQIRRSEAAQKAAAIKTLKAESEAAAAKEN